MDSEGSELPPGGGALLGLARIARPASLSPNVASCDVLGVTDVRTPLTGPEGAARTFGPQKGAGPADVDVLQRWPMLRGETVTGGWSGPQWDYVILIGDPHTMETMPGLYAQGVAAIAAEVAKGSGETVLLMPWPASGNRMMREGAASVETDGQTCQGARKMARNPVSRSRMSHW